MRFLEKLREAFVWLNTHSGGAGVILTIGGALYLYFAEYRPAQHERAVAETLKYIERLQRDPLLQARADVDSVLLRDDVQTSMIAVRDVRPNAERYRKEDEILSGAIRSSPRLQTAILALRDLYTSVSQCVQTEICDEETACRFFYKPMLNLRNTHSGILKEWGQKLRQHYPDRLTEEDYLLPILGADFVELVDRCKRRQAASKGLLCYFRQLLTCP